MRTERRDINTSGSVLIFILSSSQEVRQWSGSDPMCIGLLTHHYEQVPKGVHTLFHIFVAYFVERKTHFQNIKKVYCFLYIQRDI